MRERVADGFLWGLHWDVGFYPEVYPALLLVGAEAAECQ